MTRLQTIKKNYESRYNEKASASNARERFGFDLPGRGNSKTFWFEVSHRMCQEEQKTDQTETTTETAEPKETLNTLIEKYENFVPVYEVARVLDVSYQRLWNWIYSLMRADKVMVYSLQEGMNYTHEQLSWIDSQGLFFIEFPVAQQTERQRLGLAA